MVFYNLCEYDNHMRKLPLVYHEQAMETGNSSNFFFFKFFNVANEFFTRTAVHLSSKLFVNESGSWMCVSIKISH